MHEAYLSATENGVTNVEVVVDDESYWKDVDGASDQMTNPGAVSVRVSFAVATDAEAWVTIDGDGEISPSFGGTGLLEHEVEEYIQQAVDIWSAITGNSAACTLTQQISPQ